MQREMHGRRQAAIGDVIGAAKQHQSGVNRFGEFDGADNIHRDTIPLRNKIPSPAGRGRKDKGLFSASAPLLPPRSRLQERTSKLISVSV